VSLAVGYEHARCQQVLRHRDRLLLADHLPPHFHAFYSGDEAMINIRTGAVLRGSLPARALSLANEWRALHVDELLDNWERARQRQALAYINPLE
jgi:hypothetical protein